MQWAEILAARLLICTFLAFTLHTLVYYWKWEKRKEKQPQSGSVLFFPLLCVAWSKKLTIFILYMSEPQIFFFFFFFNYHAFFFLFFLFLFLYHPWCLTLLVLSCCWKGGGEAGSLRRETPVWMHQFLLDTQAKLLVWQHHVPLIVHCQTILKGCDGNF